MLCLVLVHNLSQMHERMCTEMVSVSYWEIYQGFIDASCSKILKLIKELVTTTNKGMPFKPTLIDFYLLILEVLYFSPWIIELWWLETKCEKFVSSYLKFHSLLNSEHIRSSEVRVCLTCYSYSIYSEIGLKQSPTNNLFFLYYDLNTLWMACLLIALEFSAILENLVVIC